MSALALWLRQFSEIGTSSFPGSGKLLPRDEEIRRLEHPAKQQGWGWGLPTVWQGWAVMALFVLLLIAGSFVLRPEESLAGFFAFSLGASVIFITICYVKGEPPRWR